MRALTLVMVAALAGGCPARGGLGPLADVPRPGAVVAAVALVDGDVAVFAADADAVTWIAGDALWRRTWTGPPVQLAELPAIGLALALRGDKIYIVSESTLAVVPARGGAPITVATGLPRWSVVAIDRDGAWFGTDGGIYRAPLDGGRPEQIAVGLPAIVAIAVDRDHVYAAAASATAAADDLPVSRIVRVGKHGGAIAQLADHQRGVRGLAVAGDRLLWANQGGPALVSVAVAGGPRALELGGAAAALAADAGGAVIMTPTGALAETARRRSKIARGRADQRLAGAGPIALAGAGVVVPMQDLATGAASLWRVPRPLAAPDSATILAAPYYTVGAVAADQGDVIFTDTTRAEPGDRPSRVMRVARTGGGGRVIASAPSIAQLAAGDGRVAYAAGETVWLIDRNPTGDGAGDRPPRRLTTAPDAPIGLTLADRAAYWADGRRVLSAPLTGGGPSTFVEPQLAIASQHLGAVDLIVDGDMLYFSSLGYGAAGVFRAPRGGPPRQLTADDLVLGDGLARVGRALYAVVGGSGLVRVPMDGGAIRTLLADDGATTLLRVIGGRALIGLRLIGDTAQIERIDPATGARHPLWTLPSSSEATPGALTADDAAVYTYLADTAWLIAIPR